MAAKRVHTYWLIVFLFACINTRARQAQTFLFSIEHVSQNGEAVRIPGKQGGDTTMQTANSGLFNYINFTSYNTLYQIRFSVTNKPGLISPALFIEYHNFRSIKLFRLVAGRKEEIISEREKGRHGRMFITEADYVYPLSLQKDSAAAYELEITTFNPVTSLTASICTPQWAAGEINLKIFTVAVYIGVMMATFFYNLFVFFSLKDRSYLWYCLYILFLCCAQVYSLGYGLGSFVASHSFFDQYAVNLFTSVAFIAGLLFALYFLQIQMYAKKAAWIIWIILASYVFVILCSFFNLNKAAYFLLNANALVTCFSLLVISYYVMRKGYAAAAYYLIAYVVLLTGLIIYVLKNYGIIQPSWFVNNVIIIGSALEAVLLSIALANRINILRKEKEISQAQALRISTENERLVRDQNIILEKSVAERTEELQSANLQLNGALTSLKDAQAQLVDAEKMASLGQLTAGIAHEINNPINFVKSNINPLRLDVKDIFSVFKEYNSLHKLSGDASVYKKQLQQIEQLQREVDIDFIQNEVYQLIKGIEDGAERTAEIVRGLRTFSRLDESELKVANVHDGINSTLVLIRNNIPFEVQVIKNFTAAGDIECYPGKLNQVFMNIITNGLQAIQAKPVKTGNENVTISTRDIDGGMIEITIKDTGTGMTDEVKHRIFEPFFTTKEVGEGTGLGMAIVFKIIEKHHGKIAINSSPGNGAEFILTLPHSQPVT